MTKLDVQALIFDFDGGIVGSVAIKIQAFAEIYRGEDPEKIEAVLAYQKVHGGVSRCEKFAHFERALFGRVGDTVAVERLSRQFTEYVHNAVVRCPFIDGAEEFLKLAQGRVPMHLVSGTPQDELLDILDQRDLSRFFETVTGAPTRKLAAFEAILSKVAYTPQRLLAIGDSITEFEAAREVGISFLGIVAPSEENPFLEGIPTLPSSQQSRPMA
jgi:phosphoglycolate phosphatase